MEKKTVGFIGAGNMATAIIKGLVSAGSPGLGKISAFDVRREKLDALARDLGVLPAESNEALCRNNEVVILAVKPQNINEVLREISGAVNEEKLLISIAAGVNLFQIESHLKRKARLIRVMPNAPLLAGCGMTAVSYGNTVKEDDKRFVLDMFGAVGRVIEVGEHLMDAVTALSGSGPAFVFSFIEGLADGGVKVGIGREEALLMAAQTVAGAARMMLSTGLHPCELKDMITSPGGTTIQGCHVLDSSGFGGIVMSAVEAAYKRAREMGQK